MVAFRKSLSMLAMVAGLLLGSSAIASAQTSSVTCAVNAGVPPIVRAEGLTELVGDIVLTCTGGNPTQPFLANFQVFLNTNVTSRILGSNLTEALLMIDEPGSPTTGQQICLSPGTASNTAGGPGGGAAPTCNTDGTAGQQNGTYTVFRGETTAQQGAIVWPGIPVVPAGTTGARVFRITNLRANAAAIGASSTLIPNQITAFISVSPSNSISINNPQQTVAYVQRGLTFDVRNCTNSGGGNPSFAQCVGLNTDVFGDPNRSGATGASFGLRFQEGFQTSFKRRIEAGQPESRPGDVYNSESGFVRTTVDGGAAFGNIGVATSATRVAARFRDIPADIRIFVSVQSVGTFTTDANGVVTSGANARLVQAGPNGEGGTFGGTGLGSLIVPVTATTNLSCTGTPAGPSDTPDRNAAEVPIVNGTGTAVWEVTDAFPQSNDTLFFLVAAAYRAVPATPTPAVGQARVSGTFAPFYAGGNDLANAAGRASAALPIPRFIETTDLANAFNIGACETNLLFPFVTAQAGFDTGIAISNTSADHFANPQNRRQGGRCTLNYFGNVTGGGNAPNPQTTNADIPAGGQMTAVLSTGGNFGIAGTPGFQGYIFARCTFRYAHGFAFITDGPIGSANVAEGYLALVVDGGTVNQPRGVVFGENLGH